MFYASTEPHTPGTGHMLALAYDYKRPTASASIRYRIRYKGKVWIRVGSRRAIATEHEERLLMERRISPALTFDAMPCVEASLTDLVLPRFTTYRSHVVDKEVIETNHRDITEQLASLRFFDLKAGSPTFGGVLLFCERSRYFLPGAYVQFLRLPGNDLTSLPLDQAEVAGPLQDVIHEIELRARVNTRSRVQSASSFRQVEVSEYPLDAIREFILNAIVHRDYQSTAPVRLSWFEDRVEISSPGGLHGGVTVESIERRSSYRNPVLAEALKGLGYVNRYGYGIQRAQRLLKDNGNPPATIIADAGGVTVVVRRRVDDCSGIQD